MTKYQEYVNKMIDENKEIFDIFKNLHDRYGLEQEKLQEEFNEIGGKVMQIVRTYEDRLCGRTEGSGYGSFSGNLAQKFQEELRKIFPLIDNVGIKIKPAFSLKKINL